VHQGIRASWRRSGSQASPTGEPRGPRRATAAAGRREACIAYQLPTIGTGRVSVIAFEYQKPSLHRPQRETVGASFLCPVRPASMPDEGQARAPRPRTEWGRGCHGGRSEAVGGGDPLRVCPENVRHRPSEPPQRRGQHRSRRTQRLRVPAARRGAWFHPCNVGHHRSAAGLIALRCAPRLRRMRLGRLPWNWL
jgi:hypothetical protein